MYPASGQPEASLILCVVSDAGAGKPRPHDPVPPTPHLARDMHTQERGPRRPTPRHGCTFPGLVGCTFRERPAGGAGVEEKGRGTRGALRPEEAGTAEEGMCGEGRGVRRGTGVRLRPAEEGMCEGKVDGVCRGGQGVRLRPEEEGTAEEGMCEGKVDGVCRGGRGVQRGTGCATQAQGHRCPQGQQTTLTPKGTRGVSTRLLQAVLLQALARDPEEAGITLRSQPPAPAEGAALTGRTSASPARGRPAPARPARPAARPPAAPRPAPPRAAGVPASASCPGPQSPGASRRTAVRVRRGHTVSPTQQSPGLPASSTRKRPVLPPAEKASPAPRPRPPGVWVPRASSRVSPAGRWC